MPLNFEGIWDFVIWIKNIRNIELYYQFPILSFKYPEAPSNLVAKISSTCLIIETSLLLCSVSLA